MKVNQTRHLNYKKKKPVNREMKDKKLEDTENNQNGNSEPFPLTVIIVTLPMDLITTQKIQLGRINLKPKVQLCILYKRFTLEVNTLH